MLKTIALLKENDTKARKVVFEKYSEVLMLLAKRYMRDTMLAEDMVVNAFLSVFKSVKKTEFDNTRSFEAWIKRIVINECLTELRRKNSFQMLPQEAAEELPVPNDILDEMSTKELLKVITELPTGYRTVFNMYVMEGFSHKEIAQKLSVSVGTSKSQLSHAKKLLRTKITNIYGKEARYGY